MSEGAIQQKMVMNRADCRVITPMLFDHKLPHYKQKFLCTVTKLEVQKGILDGMNRGRRPTRRSTADQRSQANVQQQPNTPSVNTVRSLSTRPADFPQIYGGYHPLVFTANAPQGEVESQYPVPHVLQSRCLSPRTRCRQNSSLPRLFLQKA